MGHWRAKLQISALLSIYIHNKVVTQNWKKTNKKKKKNFLSIHKFSREVTGETIMADTSNAQWK